MGSTKSLAMDRVVQEIWKYAIERRLWLTVTHIPGILNVEADKESRKTETRTEWMLNKEVFQDTIENLNFQPTVDLFASRINTQLEKFYSFRPDPKSYGVDAFTTDWNEISFYAFPPFACIPRTIQKIHHDKAVGILIVPDWPNQSWYGSFLGMIVKNIILLPRKDLLQLPQKKESHPLCNHLRLIAAIVSGRLC